MDSTIRRMPQRRARRRKSPDRASSHLCAGSAPPPPHNGHVSLEGVHGTVAVPHAKAGFWRQWRAFVGPALLVSVGYMDPGNWGTDLAGRRAVQVRAAVGRRAGQPHGDLHAGHLRPPGRGHRQGPRPGLPRLVSALDPLAQLDRSARSPSAPATWPKCSAAPSRSTCCSTSRCSGRSSSPRFDVLLLLALQGFGMRTIEAVIARAGGDDRRLLLHRDLRPAADAARLRARWARRCSRPASARPA